MELSQPCEKSKLYVPCPQNISLKDRLPSPERNLSKSHETVSFHEAVDSIHSLNVHYIDDSSESSSSSLNRALSESNDERLPNENAHFDLKKQSVNEVDIKAQEKEPNCKYITPSRIPIILESVNYSTRLSLMPLEADIDFIDTSEISANSSDFSVTTVSSITSSHSNKEPAKTVSSVESEENFDSENIFPRSCDLPLQKMAFANSHAETHVQQTPSTSYASCAVLLTDADFIDDSGAICKKSSMGSTKLFGSNESGIVFHVPNMTIPPDIQYIDEAGSYYVAEMPKRTQKTDAVHSSFRIPRKPPSRRRLCRHHSDSETRQQYQERPSSASRYDQETRPRTKKVRRSVSAIESNKSRYRPRVRRSVSDRSGLVIAGKHLGIPRSRPHSIGDIRSSKCSSTKTLASNVSMSDVVAVELGLRNIPGLTAKEARRKRIVCTVMVITMTILIVSVILVVVTLFLSPEVDAILRKGNEEIYRSMSAGASTSSPTTEGAVVTNNSTPPSGTPG